MARVRARVRHVPKVEHHCDHCGGTPGSDELRGGMSVSRGRPHMRAWHEGRCPGCKASLTKPEVDDCTVSDMTATMAYGATGGARCGFLLEW